MMRAPAHIVNGEIFNIGKTSDCLRIREVADVIISTIPNSRIVENPHAGHDHRSYRIDDSKFRSAFPEFRFTWEVATGVADLVRQYSRINLTEAHLRNEMFRRLPVLLNHIRLGQVESGLFWAESHHPVHEAV